MRWRHIIEAPISHLGVHGDLDTAGSFRPSDLKALRNPKWVQKVTDMFARVPLDINLYFYNAPEGKVHLGEPIDLRDLEQVGAYAGAVMPYRIEKIIGGLPENWQTSINAILMTNEGSERMAMTPWMVGHRLVHALFYETQRGISNIARDHHKVFGVYSDLINRAQYRLESDRTFARATREAAFSSTAMVNEIGKRLGTTRAAREGKGINASEWLVDICVQWLVRGRVIFQRPVICAIGATEPVEIEETPLLVAAREWRRRNGWDGRQAAVSFADEYIKTHHEEPRPNQPRYQPDYEGYVALAPNGQAMAAGRFTPERIADYERDGFKVERLPSGPDQLARDQKLYQRYRRRREKIENQYLEWMKAGHLAPFEERGSDTDKFHRELAEYERRFGDAIAEYFQNRVGKFYVL